MYFFRAYDQRLVKKNDSSYLVFENGESQFLVSHLVDDSWDELTEGSNVELRQPLVWTGFDVLNEDGTVYVAASEPIPVYE